MIKRNFALPALTAWALLVSAPAFAQIPAGGMAPGAMATAIAAAFLAAFSATAVAAGSIKAYQVWTGGRNPYEAFKFMAIGVALAAGTAAVVGFAG